MALAAAAGIVVDELERARFLLAPGVDDVGMCAGELVGHRAKVKRRLAVLGQLAAGDEILAVLAQLVEGRQPRVGGIDVTSVERRQNGLWLQVDQLNVVGGQPVLRQRGQQAVVRGRRERRADPLALQFGDRVDTAAVARHERLVVAGDVEHERNLVRDVQRRGEPPCDGTRAERAEVQFLGDERGVDVGTGVELRPLDVVVRQLLLQPTAVLHDQVATRKALVANANRRLVGLVPRTVDRAAGQRQRCAAQPLRRGP